MNVFPWRLLIILIFVLGLGLGQNATFLSAEPVAEDEEQGVSFRWAFGAIVRAEKNLNFVPVERDTILKSGDKLKMFVELQKKCFVYLIYHSAQGKVRLLFPYNLKMIEADYKLLKKYYIPQGDAWFELDDDVGIETYYLLASARRLSELETLVENYETVGPQEKEKFAEQIHAEIRRLRWENRKFKTSAERPVTIMGNRRGSDKVAKERAPDVTNLAVEISSKHFYSRTFTIDHR